MRTKALPVVAMVLACAGFYGSALCASAVDQRLARYMAGCFAIRYAEAATPSQKIEAYRKLASATGMESAEARRLVEQYRDRPAEWSALLIKVRESLDKTP